MKPRNPETYTPLSPQRQAQLQVHRLASFRARAGAIVLDSLVVFGLVALIEALFSLHDTAKSANVDILLDFEGLASLAVVVMYFGLTIFFWNGRTFGKRLFRIRVLPVGQDRLSLSCSVQRALAYSVSAAVLGLGFLQYFRNANRQTVHDRIAETIVVEERPSREP